MSVASLIRTRQTPTLTWAASSIVSQDIIASGAITRMHLRIAVVPSATMVADQDIPEGVWRIIQTLNLRGNGGVTYLSFGDMQISRMIHLLNRHDGLLKGAGHHALAAANSYEYILHFGSHPFDQFGRENPWDMSAFIPGFEDTGLKLEWGTTANSVMDSVITLASAVMTVTLFQVLGTKGEILSEMHRQGVRQPMVPCSTYISYPHVGNYSNVSKEFDIPAGAYIRRIAIMAQSDSATVPVRADDEITEVAIKLPVGNQRVFFDDMPSLSIQQGVLQDNYVADLAVTGGALCSAPGFAVVDLRQQADPDYGLDLRTFKTGDLKLGVTVAAYTAGDDSFYWFDQLRPYKM
jgi:hypothetical protein